MTDLEQLRFPVGRFERCKALMSSRDFAAQIAAIRQRPRLVR